MTLYLDELWYPNTLDNWDDILFREHVLTVLTPSMVILDLGAGAGIVKQMNFLGQCARVCGVDLDPRVMNNPYLDEAHISNAENIPYDSSTFDLVVADNVMEHLAHPEEVLREIHRVLKPGGHLLFKTPNKWHYMPCIARVTPLWFHRYFNKIRNREMEDTFPTVYKLNSTKDVMRLANSCGYNVDKMTLVENRPEYLRFSALTYFIGMLYERAVTYLPGLSWLRILLIAQLTKTR